MIKRDMDNVKLLFTQLCTQSHFHQNNTKIANYDKSIWVLLQFLKTMSFSKFVPKITFDIVRISKSGLSNCNVTIASYFLQISMLTYVLQQEAVKWTFEILTTCKVWSRK